MHFSQAQGVIFGVPRAGAGPDDPCGSHSDSGYSPPPPTWPPSRMCQKAPPLLSLSWALIGPMGARAAAGSGAPRPPAAGVRLPRQPGAGGARGPGAEGRAEPEPEPEPGRGRFLPGRSRDPSLPSEPPSHPPCWEALGGGAAGRGGRCEIARL